MNINKDMHTCLSKTSTIIVWLFLFPILSFAGNKKDYNCTFTTAPVEIDGKSDEAIWKTIEPVWFVANKNKNKKLKTKTYFKVCWDKTYLYFYCWMQDDDITGQMTMRDDHIWYEEVLEIFIDADCNPKNYYEFEWNPLNTLLDLYVMNPGCNRDVIKQWWSWDCIGIKSAININGTINNSKDTDEGWALEVAIPFSQIQTAPNIPPKANDSWKFDLTRREGTEKDADLQKSSWLPPSGHFPLSYGNLIFKK